MAAIKHFFLSTSIPALALLFSACANHGLQINLPQGSNQTVNGSSNSSSGGPTPTPTPTAGLPGSQTFAGTTFGTGTNLQFDSAGIAAKQGSYVPVPSGTGVTQQWKTLSWIPTRPYWKALPSATETGYPQSNANMTGLQLLMHFDEPAGLTSFADSSVNRATASCGGGAAACPTSGAPGRFNTALKFDAAQQQYLKLSPQASMGGAKPFSVEAWINTSMASGAGIIVQQRDSGQLGDDGSFQFFVGQNTQNGFTNLSVGGLGFWTEDTSGGSGSLRLTTTGVNVADGKWHHVVAVREADPQGQAIGKIYVDGGPPVATSPAVHMDSLDAQNNGPLNGVYIGYDPKQSANYFSGTIDEVAIYSNRALSATEVADHYQRGALRLKFQVQTCSLAAPCTDAAFVGPDGHGTSFFTEQTNTASTPPTLALPVGLAPNPFFQYKLYMESDIANTSPTIDVTTIKASP